MFQRCDWVSNTPASARPSTIPQSLSRCQAAALVDCYSRRWRIEEWHRILKSGCQVEEHQHQTGERLKRAIALDVVLAWRIQLLVLLGRPVPELPCEIFFDNWEVKVLEAVQPQKRPDTRGKGGKGKRPLLLGEAVTQVAPTGRLSRQRFRSSSRSRMSVERNEPTLWYGRRLSFSRHQSGQPMTREIAPCPGVSTLLWILPCSRRRLTPPMKRSSWSFALALSTATSAFHPLFFII